MNRAYPILLPLFLTTCMALFLPASATAQGGGNTEARIPLLDSPTKEIVYFVPEDRPQPQPDPSSILRTGIKKGVLDHTLDLERFAGPDAAILKNGFFKPWPRLLAEFREASVLVDVKSIAGLEKTKPYLIIPSGALQGYSRSKFVKASLSEYARAGGVILCFAQQNGADLSVLPVPAGTELTGAGWIQDNGPFFRKSSVQNHHLMLTGTGKTTPDLETSGYLITYPDFSTVIMSRSDGYPTLIVYPYGSGWVVIATLFSDYSYDRDQLNDDEKVLVRDMILWAKEPSALVKTAPGEQNVFPLLIQGPRQGKASHVKITVRGTDGNKILTEKIFATTVKTGQIIPLPFAYVIPADIRHGIYHLEYVLADSEGRPLTSSAECYGGRFAVGQPDVAPFLRRQSKPLGAGQVPFRVQPSLTRTGDAFRLKIDMLPEAGFTGKMKDSFLVRAAGQDKFFNIGTNHKSVEFVVPAQGVGQYIPFSLYDEERRSLIRGSLPVATSAGNSVFLDEPFYSSGQKVSVTRHNAGKGEFTLTAPGFHGSKMVAGKGVISFTLPQKLPAGTYIAEWVPASGIKEGGHSTFPLSIVGYRVTIRDTLLEHTLDQDISQATVRFHIHATQMVNARMKLSLLSPDNTVVPAAESLVALFEGDQEVPITFAFKPESTGIWQLHYALDVQLPEGPGLTRDPLVIAAGHIPFDVGKIAVLGVATTKPVYSRPSGPVGLTAYFYGNTETAVDFFLDNTIFLTEKIKLSGPHVLNLSIPGAVRPGAHTVAALIPEVSLPGRAKQQFIYGTLFPDLIVDIGPLDLSGRTMPVTCSVTNQGTVASGPSTVALYDGDPNKQGQLVATAMISPIEPGETNSTVFSWSLLNKVGTRTLFAVANADHTIVESNTNNNTTTVDVDIPELLFSVRPSQKAFGSHETILLSVITTNLTQKTFSGLSSTVELLDSSGKSLAATSHRLTELRPGSENRFDASLPPATVAAGSYQLRSQLALFSPLISLQSDITINPTLLLKGTLEVPEAVSCRPFIVSYHVKNAGNIPPSDGTLTLELWSADTGKMMHDQKRALSIGSGSFPIDNKSFLRGNHRFLLKAHVRNKKHVIEQDILLDEKPLSFVHPVTVIRENEAVPRVLFWLGKGSAAVLKATAEKIARQTVENDDAFFSFVETQWEFAKSSLSGNFNTLVLFEPEEDLAGSDWLIEHISGGHGLIIIGAGIGPRKIGELFGFTYGETSVGNDALLMTGKDSLLEMTGSMPLSGQYLLPKKDGSQVAALFANSSDPAVLIDEVGSGKVIVMPFSLTRSAIDAGITSVYSFLLRSAIKSVAPKTDERSGVASTSMTVTALKGPVRARVLDTHPPGTRILWTNTGGSVKDNIITYDLVATEDPSNLRYVFQPPMGSTEPAVTDVLFECNNTFYSQGKLK